MFKVLSRQHIRQQAEFGAVFKRAKRLAVSPFVFNYVVTDRTYPRLGMVINKRNCKLAVDLNRIKRIIREQFRLHQHQLSGIDLVVALQSLLDKLSDQERIACIQKLFTQLVALCEKSCLP